MKNNNKKCCKKDIPCAPKKCTCGDIFKEQYEQYLQEEACKEPDPVEDYGLCDIDFDVVYLIQYRRKPKKKKPLD